MALARPDEPGEQPGGPGIGTEAAGDERLPEDRVVRGDREIGGQSKIAAEADRPALDAAHHRQMNVVHEFDDAVGRVGDATHQVSGARTASGVGGHPVGTGAEVVGRAQDVDGTEGIVGRRFGQCADEGVGHRVAQ